MFVYLKLASDNCWRRPAARLRTAPRVKAKWACVPKMFSMTSTATIETVPRRAAKAANSA